MLRPIDLYFLKWEEPEKSCMQSLREYILAMDKNISEDWKYGMPFYNFNGKRFCYIWYHKKFKQPYLGIVDGALTDHPDLIKEERARMKILLLDPSKNLPVSKINAILKKLLPFYLH